MTTKLATFLAVLLFALLVLGGRMASAQAPDGASHERVQQQRAPAACPPDIQWGCVLSGSTSPGLTLNSTSTAKNAYSLYASLNNPGSGAAAVWGRVLGTGSTGYGVYGSHQGSGYGVYGNSNTGIGFYGYSNTNTGMQGQTNSTGASPGVLGIHSATTGTGAGVEGRTNSTSTDAAGIRGVHTATSGAGAGVEGRTNSMSNGAAGVLGIATATNPGTHMAGVRAINSNTAHQGYGVWGSHAGGGKGVYGTSGSGEGVFGSSGSGYGVYGYSSSGWGVHGSSKTTGVYGESSGSGYGVSGTSAIGIGVHGSSITSTGVYGVSHAGNAIEGYSATSFAGYFNGPVHVSGDLEVSGSIGQPAGTTRIDHPLDPENQYLSHSFVDSPDMMSVYNGNVVLGANGEAVVEMPTYFQTLNRDFRYQLTAIGAPGPNLYVAQEVEDNRFTIAGGTPGMKVSWEVTGIRQDAWANEHRILVEELKPEGERGTYLYPEGYGQPESRGVNYEEEQRMRKMGGDAPPAPAEAPGQ
ncbi:MAG TPA: hypothetical protein VF707_11255 [Ardenticatenaceae bacterium]